MRCHCSQVASDGHHGLHLGDTARAPLLLGAFSITHSLSQIRLSKSKALENFRLPLKYVLSSEGRAVVAAGRWQVLVSFLLWRALPTGLLLFHSSPWWGRTRQAHPILLTKEESESTSALKSLRSCGF